MLIPLEKVEGRKFCVVFVKVIDKAAGKVQLQCLRGRANVERGRLSVVNSSGASFTVPGTAMQTILPSDGTDILQDAEYYCMVRVDDNISLSPKDSPAYDLEEDDDHECSCGCHHDDHECSCGCHHDDHECSCHHDDHECSCHHHDHECSCHHDGDN